MPAAAIPAVTGALGVGASIFGGITGANAAAKAAAAQKAAADQAGQNVINTAAQVNPQITTAASTAGTNLVGAAGTAAGQAGEAARNAGIGVGQAATNANDILQPYQTAGSSAADVLNKGIATGGDFNKTPTLADLQIDPGFAFRLAQGATTLDRSAAARGGVESGAALKDLTNYSQGAASQEYQNAFNRFETSQQNRFKNVSDVAGLGLQAGGQQGQNLLTAGKYTGDTGIQATEFGGQLNTNATQHAGDLNYNAATTTAGNTLGAAEKAGDYLTQGANAQASGIVGGANAVSGAIGQGLGALTSAGGLYNALKNPQVYAPQRPAMGPPVDSSTILNSVQPEPKR